MSNTDGEDTQKVSLGELLLNAGTRIVDLEKQSNDQVEIITHLEKELASLREQLAKKDEDAIQAIDALTKQIAELMHQLKQKDLEAKYWLTQSKTLQSDLKQKEDENRELINKIQEEFTDMEYTKWTTMEVIQFLESFKNNLSA